MAHKYSTYLNIFTGKVTLAYHDRHKVTDHVLIGRSSRSRFPCLQATFKDHTWYIAGKKGNTVKYQLSPNQIEEVQRRWAKKVAERLLPKPKVIWDDFPS